MNEPKSLDSLFKEKIFRIPDYQRGYAWQKSQLKDFWEDLINLSGDRSHYTGVLTLKEVSSKEVSETDNEYWLVEDHSYKMYHIVDGQQRLTTFVVFIQAFIDFVKQLNENTTKPNHEIYITDSLSLEAVINRYLFKTKPTGDQYRTYKFGYTVDNPSYEYLRHKIFNEDGSPSIEETFYTLNLRNAKLYFYEQLKELYSESGMSGLQEVYKKLTKKFLFNEYVIKDEFDVFVAFETMNNRGKRLSDLELLKNRLIYLTTLYTDDELDAAERKSLRDGINSAWKEVYYQLGRNDKRPLNDDDFLKAHWIMYFQYSRKKGNDYIKFLLDEHFSPQKVHKKIEWEVALDLPEEQLTDSELDIENGDNGSIEDIMTAESDFIAFVNANTKAGAAGKIYMRALRDLEELINDEVFNAYSLDQLDALKKRLSNNGDLHDFNVQTNNRAPGAAIGKLIEFYCQDNKQTDVKTVAYLQPHEIKLYVNSLKESAVHWFNSYYPNLSTGLSDDEKTALDRLNRIGMGYFRPLIMSVFKNEKNSEKRIELLNHIERFIFITFRLSQARSNYRDSEFYNASREFNQSELTLEEVKQKLDNAMTYCFHEGGMFNSKYFYDYLYKRFNSAGKSGYYGWHGLRYFLYEYELNLLSQSRQKKVAWEDLLKTPKDKVSIEHVFPQTPTDGWKSSFAMVDEKNYPLYNGSLGNLLLLSMSINSSLQNDEFRDKKQPKFNDTGEKIRNGYSDGSHSEIEVAQHKDWTPETIKERGLCLLNFMEDRWGFKFANNEDKEALLFLDEKPQEAKVIL
jgi:uncharacterized protein with ParB-like and HNH nuclease domain